MHGIPSSRSHKVAWSQSHKVTKYQRNEVTTQRDHEVTGSAGPFRGHQAVKGELPIIRCPISHQSDVLSADVNVQMSDVAMVDSRTED